MTHAHTQSNQGTSRDQSQDQHGHPSEELIVAGMSQPAVIAAAAEPGGFGAASPGAEAPHAAPVPGRTHRRIWLSLIILGFLAFCSNVRSPINVIPPLVGQIGAELHMGDVALGALTSVPVLCFGVLTPVMSLLVRRLGANTSGALALTLIIAGAALRGVGPVWVLFASTIIIGAGITIANLVAPMIIGRDFWHKTATMTGLYSAICNVWVTAATALAVPLAVHIGWRGSAAVWAIAPTAAALALWLWVFPPGLARPRGSLLRRSGMDHWVVEKPASARATTAAPVWKRAIPWVMAVTFACHTFSYNAVIAWLPTVLVDLVHMSQAQAGVAASIFSLTGIIGPLLVPVMFGALHWSGRRVLAVISACWVALPLALVVAPAAWFVPCVLSGIAQGGFFAALFTIVIERSATVDENRETTALIQTTGYIVAATGPVTLGALHSASGDWLVPFLTVLAILTVMTVGGQIVAAPPRSPATVIPDGGAQETGESDPSSPGGLGEQTAEGELRRLESEGEA